MNLPRTSCFCHKIYAFGLGFNMAVILSAQSLTKSYGVRPLFTGLSVNLDEKDRIGLIGPNGAGKSTFLKLLANHEVPDEGNVSCRRSTRIGYVAQDDRFPEGQTVRDVLIAAQANLNREDSSKNPKRPSSSQMWAFLTLINPLHHSPEAGENASDWPASWSSTQIFC